MKLGEAHFWTNSELSDWRRCLRKSYLTHVLKLGPAGGGRLPTWSITGDLVHEPLAEYYASGGDLVALGLMARDKAIERQQTKLHGDDTPLPIQSLVSENVISINEEWELVKVMLEGYVDWLEEEGEDESLKVISTEEEMYVPVESASLPGTHYLLGKLDMRVFDERIGARSYMDHKTVQAFSDREKTAAIDSQFLFYGLLEYMSLLDKGSSTNPDWVDGGIFNMLRKSKRTVRAKPPFFKRLHVRYNDTQLENMYVRTMGEILSVMQRITALDEGVDYRMLFPPNPTKDCSWDCPFFSLCPMMDDGSDFQGFIDSSFQKRSPLARYSTIPQEE